MSKLERVLGLLALLSLLGINVGYIEYVNHRSQQRAEENRRLFERDLCAAWHVELELYALNPPDNKLRQDRFDAYDRLWKQNCL